MMLDVLSVIVAMVGTGVASYIDLTSKDKLIPDKIPGLMILFGLIIAFFTQKMML